MTRAASSRSQQFPGRSSLITNWRHLLLARVDCPGDTCGFRVPAVIVSPYVRQDCVLPDVFDHTWMLKFIEEKWNLPALTLRDAAATSPLGALDLAAPPAFLTPPELPAPARRTG
jgi:phospholipase C